MTHPEHAPASLPATRRRRSLPADGRTGRARRARTDAMAVRPLRGGRYAVETDDARYVVGLDGRTCTCPDRRIRGARCKHLRRVALEVTSGLVPPPGERTAVCAVCGGATFVPTTATGPALCSRHAHRPGTVVADRETGDELLVVDGPGGRADAVETDEGRVVADYASNAAYGGHEPVVRAVYLDALDGDGVPRRYAFPASRLRPVDAGARNATERSEADADADPAEAPA
jgi:hypothetical protein